MNDMPVRIMDFDIDREDIRKSVPALARGLGLSMTFPYIEPYLIRTMRGALEFATDEQLIQDVKQFIGQEEQHFRQHQKVNDVLRGLCPAYAELQVIEDELASDYQRFTTMKSLRFNLAYAEGFESATCSVARQELTRPEPGDTGIQRLLKWHGIEELEHRTVTFDLYHHLYGGYFYRLLVGMFAQYHYFKYVLRFAGYISQHSPSLDQPKAAVARTSGQKIQEAKELFSLIGKLLKTHSPFYNPAKLQMTELHASMSSQYSSDAIDTRAAGA